MHTRAHTHTHTGRHTHKEGAHLHRRADHDRQHGLHRGARIVPQSRRENQLQKLEECPLGFNSPNIAQRPSRRKDCRESIDAFGSRLALHGARCQCLRSFTALRKDAGLCCGSRLLEGRSVCLCWAPSKPKGPKGWGCGYHPASPAPVVGFGVWGLGLRV